MVVDTPVPDPIDVVFHALADATRRDILTLAVRGDLSVSDLGRRYPISLTAVQKHVAVLERAGLVRRRRLGRAQLVQTDPQALRAAGELLDRIEQSWRDRLDRFADVLAAPEDEGYDA